MQRSSGTAVDETLDDEIRYARAYRCQKQQIHGSSERRQLKALRSSTIEFVN